MNRYMNAALAGLIAALVVILLGVAMMGQYARRRAVEEPKPIDSLPGPGPMRIYYVEIDEAGIGLLPPPRHSTPYCVVRGADIYTVSVDTARIRIEPPQPAKAVCVEVVP